MVLPQHSAATILVTGAGGQLGSEIRNIASQFPSYNFLFTSKEELAIEDEIAVKEFFEKHEINYCINCAAYTAVDKAESEKEKAFLINADAAGVLATICKQHHAKLIHISTDYVYDGTAEKPLQETNAIAPLNVYGLSKLRGEELAIKNNSSVLVIRTSWVYSTYGNNFVKTMLRLFKEKESLNVVSDQQGSPTYAADLAVVILKFIDEMQSGNEYSGIMNYSNSGVTTWYHFALAIKEFVNSACNINPVPSSQYPTPAKRPQYSVLDTSKIKEALHIQIPDWKVSLHKCLASLLAKK